jgi:hypothetical protein
MKAQRPLLALSALLVATPAHAIPYSNISGVVVEFPSGAISFADSLTNLALGLVTDLDGGAYTPPAPLLPLSYPAGTVVPLPFARNGNEALGVPDLDVTAGLGCYTAVSPNVTVNTSPFCNFVSLGVGGSITVEFTDNFLIGSNSTAQDLWVFEIGPDIEDTFVEISKDGTNWSSVGKVFGSTFGVDIDAYGFGPADLFRFVRLTDDPAEGEVDGGTVGADIDAIGAITTTAVPAPPAVWLLLTGLTVVAARRGWHRLRGCPPASRD